MSETFLQLQARIQELKVQAEAVKRSEIAGVIDSIKEAMAVYELTRSDVFGTAASKRTSRPTKAKGRTHAVKYADGKGGTWVGRGPRPLWLREAMARGETLDSFATTQAKPKAAAKRAKKRKAGTSYRDDAGNVWGGLGPRPQWLRDAIANGKALEDFRV